MKILVLDVPALHLGYLGCYGNDWVATPNIDRLAAEGVVFDWHTFDVAQPEPFFWTGRRILPMADLADHPSSSMTLGEVLQSRNVALEFVMHREDDGLAESMHQVVAHVLERVAQGCTFVWARLPSLAPPWRLPIGLLDSYCEEEDEPWPDPPLGPIENTDDLPRLQNTYAAVVTYVDAQVGALLDQLKDKNRLDETLVCLTAAHGLPLGEHGMVGQVRPWLHEEFIHLPLILRLPQAAHAGLRIEALTQPVDLFATFLEYLGIESPASDGFNLWPLIRGDAAEVRPHAICGLAVGAAVEWALRTPEFAYLHPVKNPPHDSPRQAQLYVKPDDRWEVNDVRQHHLELADEMQARLRAEAGITGISPVPNPQ